MVLNARTSTATMVARPGTQAIRFPKTEQEKRPSPNCRMVAFITTHAFTGRNDHGIRDVAARSVMTVEKPGKTGKSLTFCRTDINIDRMAAWEGSCVSPSPAKTF